MRQKSCSSTIHPKTCTHFNMHIFAPVCNKVVMLKLNNKNHRIYDFLGLQTKYKKHKDERCMYLLVIYYIILLSILGFSGLYTFYTQLHAISTL